MVDQRAKSKRGRTGVRTQVAGNRSDIKSKTGVLTSTLYNRVSLCRAEMASIYRFDPAHNLGFRPT